MMDRSTSKGFLHSQHESYQPLIQSASHQALMDKSKYLIAEAKNLTSNRKVTYSPQGLIDDSKCLIAHAEKILNNCEAIHRCQALLLTKKSYNFPIKINNLYFKLCKTRVFRELLLATKSRFRQLKLV